MKQSITLLVTIMFISVISILILKNLDDTSTFLDSHNKVNAITQTQITIKNVNDELMSILNEHKDDIEDVVEYLKYVPLPFGDIIVSLQCEMYFNSDNLNSDTYFTDDFEEALESKQIDTYDFKTLVNKLKPFTNTLQIDELVDGLLIGRFYSEEETIQIQDLKASLTFFDVNSSVVDCNYEVNVMTFKSKVKVILNPDKKQILDLQYTDKF